MEHHMCFAVAVGRLESGHESQVGHLRERHVSHGLCLVPVTLDTVVGEGNVGGVCNQHKRLIGGRCSLVYGPVPFDSAVHHLAASGLGL